MDSRQRPPAREIARKKRPHRALRNLGGVAMPEEAPPLDAPPR
jgi:hypothetical protein